MSERFFVAGLLGPGPVTVRGLEARHMAVVCRLRPHAPVCLFNGDGREYPALIRSVSKDAVRLDVIEVASPDRELPFLLEVAAPLPRGDRGHFLVEKLTELGASRYVPLHTQRSAGRPSEARMKKLCAYVVEASKQCGRNTLLEVARPQAWLELIQATGGVDVNLLAHPGAAAGLPPARFPRGLRVALGPEGGFTEREVNEAGARGWVAVSLGPRILRVETAAVAMAAWAAMGRAAP